MCASKELLEELFDCTAEMNLTQEVDEITRSEVKNGVLHESTIDLCFEEEPDGLSTTHTIEMGLSDPKIISFSRPINQNAYYPQAALRRVYEHFIIDEYPKDVYEANLDDKDNLNYGWRRGSRKAII